MIFIELIAETFLDLRKFFFVQAIFMMAFAIGNFYSVYGVGYEGDDWYELLGVSFEQ